MITFNQAAESDIAEIAGYITGTSFSDPVVRHLFEEGGNSPETNVEIARRIAAAARKIFPRWEVCLANKSAFDSYRDDTVLGLIVRLHPSAAPAFDPMPVTNRAARGTRVQIARNQKLTAVSERVETASS